MKYEVKAQARCRQRWLSSVSLDCEATPPDFVRARDRHCAHDTERHTLLFRRTGGSRAAQRNLVLAKHSDAKPGSAPQPRHCRASSL